MPITVIAERPTPVSRRVAESPMVPRTAALSREKPEYQAVVSSNAFFRPSRSENHPPPTAPKNIPKKVHETIWLIVVTERFHCFITAGEAKAKVLRSPNSKKK